MILAPHKIILAFLLCCSFDGGLYAYTRSNNDQPWIIRVFLGWMGYENKQENNISKIPCNYHLNLGYGYVEGCSACQKESQKFAQNDTSIPCQNHRQFDPKCSACARVTAIAQAHNHQVGCYEHADCPNSGCWRCQDLEKKQTSHCQDIPCVYHSAPDKTYDPTCDACNEATRRFHEQQLQRRNNPFWRRGE